MKSKSRYFKAKNREAAEAMAVEYFGSNAKKLIFEVVSGEEDSECLLFAFSGSKEGLSNSSGGYGLFYEADGVYLELYAARGLGEPLNRAALAQHLVRKNMQRYDEAAVQNLVVNGSGRTRIAPAQQEFFFGEDVLIEIPQYEMEAKVKLLAPEPGGSSIGFDAVMQKLLKAGITHGLDEQAVRSLLEDKNYGESRVVAQATQPVDGENGKLVFHFHTDKKTARPKELDGGKVDYYSLDLYEPVEEGQILVSRTIATAGTPGMTVKGRQIKQKPGKDSAFPKGKNVLINADKTEMRAKSAGMVEYLYGSVNVSNIYKIDGDVDMGVGNIDFDGSVHISGNVLAGHVIKATGGVIVGGVVEASEIIAGGSVEVKRGMQGMDRGRIEAGGSISLLYIERGNAVAGGSITVDASIHSVIEAGESLIAKGKRGSIIGGRAIAANEIIASSIGSVSQVQTEVEVGIMPQKRTRLSALEKKTEKLLGEITKLDQLDAYLEKAQGKLDAETYDKLYRSGVENRRTYTETLEEYSAEMNALNEDLERATAGKVHVFDTVYGGTRIIIGTDMFKVHDDTPYATFKLKDGKVTYMSCEIKKG